MGENTFHFTIGPVQSFVAEARRTRDLWAGSYVLSYLSGVAMKSITDVQGHNGKIVFPYIADDPLYLAITGPTKPRSKSDLAARIGSLPNRFKAQADDAKGAAETAANSVRDSWRVIADAVLTRIEKCHGSVSEATKEIWSRQIINHWEIAWVVGEDGKLLDMRKNLRCHFPSEEPGEKCTICGERQALSGKGREDSRRMVSKWWSEVADEFNGKAGYHFLREGKERLCAICTTKRLFPITAKESIGWSVPHNFPSTSFMAAVDWLLLVLEQGISGNQVVTRAGEEFMATAGKAVIPQDEEAAMIAGIESRLLKLDRNWSALPKLRGDAFFKDAVKNTTEFHLDDEGMRAKILSALSELTSAAGKPPTPFYALLLMDGDNMGKLLSKYPDKQEDISRTLAEFTAQAGSIVEDGHNGRLIYAGGDDVFALLPMDTALNCAKMLREAYVAAFRNRLPELASRDEGTISAAIVYAPMNTVLQAIVRDAHTLLDKTAKEKFGRDAFAVRVWKRGGQVITFAKKWVENDWANEVLQVKEAFARDGEFASGFFFRLRELIPVLQEFSHEERVKLLTAEFLKSRENLGLPEDLVLKREEAERRVGKLLDLSQQLGDIRPDAALFVRFLAQKEA